MNKKLLSIRTIALGIFCSAAPFHIIKAGVDLPMTSITQKPGNFYNAALKGTLGVTALGALGAYFIVSPAVWVGLEFDLQKIEQKLADINNGAQYIINDLDKIIHEVRVSSYSSTNQDSMSARSRDTAEKINEHLKAYEEGLINLEEEEGELIKKRKGLVQGVKAMRIIASPYPILSSPAPYNVSIKIANARKKILRIRELLASMNVKKKISSHENTISKNQ